jgi:hypothetical protein
MFSALLTGGNTSDGSDRLAETSLAYVAGTARHNVGMWPVNLALGERCLPRRRKSMIRVRP